MAKEPLAGQTKTRLTPFLSPAEAAELYACFLRDTLELARSLPEVTPHVAYAPPEAGPYFRRLAPGLSRVAQRGSSLGDRLAHVMGQALASGFHQVAAMNSDSPTLPVEYLSQAFAHLDEQETDVVLGPCEDGGYYLIGWKTPHPRLVRQVEMSTGQVLEDTLALAAAEGLRAALLPPWYDVDTPQDLLRAQSDLSRTIGNARHTRRFLESHPLEMPGAG